MYEAIYLPGEAPDYYTMGWKPGKPRGMNNALPLESVLRDVGWPKSHFSLTTNMVCLSTLKSRSSGSQVPSSFRQISLRLASGPTPQAQHGHARKASTQASHGS